MFDAMRGQIHGQESNPDYLADDCQEPVDWSEFQADEIVPGSDPDEDTPDCDLRNW